MLVGGAAHGGLGSKISGGDFWQGFATGIAVGTLNHKVHSLANPSFEKLVLDIAKQKGWNLRLKQFWEDNESKID